MMLSESLINTFFCNEPHGTEMYLFVKMTDENLMIFSYIKGFTFLLIVESRQMTSYEADTVAKNVSFLNTILKN